MLRRLQVEGYKSLTGVDVGLSRLTVVFGPNAAGKSNLLDAVSLLARLVTSETLDDAFKQHRGSPLEAFTLPTGGTQALQQQHHASFTMTADIDLSKYVVGSVQNEIRRLREGLDQNRTVRKVVIEPLLRYSVTVEILTSSGHLRVMNERLEALKTDGTPKTSRAPFIERVGREDQLRLRHEGQGRPALEDVGQDRTIVSKRLYPPHYPHIAALREEMTRWRFYFLEPGEMRKEIALKEVETLASNGSDVAAFYNTLSYLNPLQFRAFVKSLQHVVASASDLQIERTPQGTLRLVVLEDGVPLSSSLISEGTLRVLGLLAITNPLQPLSVVGYEEPENGIHATRLATVARLLLTAAEVSDTQFILNTHSPVLPEYFQSTVDATLLACRKRGRVSRFNALSSAGTLFASGEIASALNDEVSTLSERLVRGDFA
jgi:predicted ATPase